MLHIPLPFTPDLVPPHRGVDVEVRIRLLCKNLTNFITLPA
jgi:hypothetical protein